MKEYAVEVAFDFYDTIFIKANSKEEAKSKVANEYGLGDKYKVITGSKRLDFDNIEVMSVGDVVNG